jgi:hypothetical protein
LAENRPNEILTAKAPKHQNKIPPSAKQRGGQVGGTKKELVIRNWELGIGQ